MGSILASLGTIRALASMKLHLFTLLIEDSMPPRKLYKQPLVLASTLLIILSNTIKPQAQSQHQTFNPHLLFNSMFKPLKPNP